MTIKRREAQLLAASTAAVIDAIARHMPAGPYREYTAWAFSPRNPRQQEFLQSMGVTQLINMNATLLGGLVDEPEWPGLLQQAGLMNAYQVLEVISDNLAIGLGNAVLDRQAKRRRSLVTAVNRAMMDALTPGRRTPAVLLLAGHAQQVAQRASGFDLSLAGIKHADMAQEYARYLSSTGRTAPTLHELEFGVWPALVANVEVCRELVDSMEGTPTASLLRQGLFDRYQAVERTLNGEHLSRLELAALGAQTILVEPTLCYLIGAVLSDQSRYAGLVEDGTVHELLSDAALLVRLQNDIGTLMLRMAPVQQAAELSRLQASGTLTAAIEVAPEPEFTRLQKDIRNGESNVALWHARRAADDSAAWAALGDSLAYFAALYAQHSARLARGLAELDQRLGDKRAGTMIERMVRFHERMYSHLHTDPVGEYAV